MTHVVHACVHDACRIQPALGVQRRTLLHQQLIIEESET